MKTFLLTVALFAAVACATPRNKRDVSHLLRQNAQYLPPQQYIQPQPQPNNQYLSPVPQTYQLPSTSYGVPFNSYQASAPAPSYGTPQVHYASVPHSTYGVPSYQQAPVYQAPVYQAPVYQAPAQSRVVFDTPVQSVVVSERVSYEQAPAAPVQYYQQGQSSSYQYNQQQQNVDSNGGYVY